jgi:acyl-CoA synthetase (AMP-forming)/AMP-acid ligase II
VLLVDRDYADKADQAGDCPALERVIEIVPGEADSKYEAWLRPESEAEPEVDITDDDDFLITYTSGTTGAAKGALFQQRQSTVHAPIAVHCYEITADSRLLMVYPHNSVASFNVFYIPAWMVGATVVLDDARGFSAKRWLGLVQAERITHCHLVPTMLFRVLEYERLAEFDLSSLQTIGYGSAPMPRERVERLSQVFGDILIQGYGMTEVTSLATVLSKQEHAEALAGDSARLASCGRPVFASEIRVVDDDGTDVPPDTIGEIVFRGPLLMSGYWGDPALTAETIVDGWLHSGDLGKLDADGYLYIVDRKKDIIISGGANISGREVEEVLYWHPAVAEAVVVGRPDPEWGEKVHAFVIPHEGEEVSADALIAFCRERLAHYKCPDRIDFAPELPRNALGKFMKTELRDRLRKTT